MLHSPVQIPSLLCYHWRELRLQWVTLRALAELVHIFWHIIFYRAREGLYVVGVRFFTFVCVILLQPLHVLLCPPGTAKQKLDKAWSLCVLEYWWEKNFQYSEFQSVLMDINMNTPLLCLSMCTKWSENCEEIGKQFCPCWSKRSWWPQQGSSCG